MSKYILGGKGTGKTHLLRYHSYQVARLRDKRLSGVETVERLGFLGVFVRATNIDAGRFEAEFASPRQWQQLFGVYLELRLAEGLLDALIDIQRTSPNSSFNEAATLHEVRRTVHGLVGAEVSSVKELQTWVDNQRRAIDVAVDNAAFSGDLRIRVPFPIGGLCIPLTRALALWNSVFASAPVIFLVDEVENFSERQQQIINSLVRYGEGVLTFRVTGRLYSRKTLATMADGEENREGSEFTTIQLDEILRRFERYPDFARRFVAKRLTAPGSGNTGTPFSVFDPTKSLEEVDPQNFFVKHVEAFELDTSATSHSREFINALKAADGEYGITPSVAENVHHVLTSDFPPIIQRLNSLLFFKKAAKRKDPLSTASSIAEAARGYIISGARRGYYANAYGHYANDLFAQLCRASRKLGRPLYAGFDCFVKMSSGNPRNLLICLGRLYELTSFREIDLSNAKLGLLLQTEAAAEAARFMYERDSNYGAAADAAREAVNRLAAVLRTARYALNIPEVSPLTVSFSDTDLEGESRAVLRLALNYSLLFDVNVGRPDRNSDNVHRKIQINPLLSPKWGLPIARRGDLQLNRGVLNAIFDGSRLEEFEMTLRLLGSRWNRPLTSPSNVLFSEMQADLFA
jgi:hypothetical protein